MEHADTDGQDGCAEQQTQERRRYGVQMLAEKCPRLVSLYFFGFGIWTAVIVIGFLLIITGRLGDGRLDPLFAAGMYCFRVLSILLSLLALWLTHSPAKHRAPHENSAPAAQEAPAERAVQRFTERYPRIASAYLYGYGIFSAVITVYVFLRGKGGTASLFDRFLAHTQYYAVLLSVPVAILAFCSLRRR